MSPGQTVFSHLTRRRLLRASAWSAPAVLAASAVPAAAVSPSDEPTAEAELFVQVHDSNVEAPYDTVFGVTSFDGKASDTSGNSQWSAEEGATGRSGLVAHGAGTFTPGGTLGGGADAGYGGAGLFISAPRTASGVQLPGRSWIPAGAVLTMTCVFEFDEDDPYPPITWNDGASLDFPAIPTPATSSRPHLNGAAFRATFGSGSAAEKTWSGTITIETTENLTASGSDAPHAQLLASQLPVYYTEHGPVRATFTLSVVRAALTIAPEGREETTIDLSGRSVTSDLAWSPAAED